MRGEIDALGPSRRRSDKSRVESHGSPNQGAGVRVNIAGISGTGHVNAGFLLRREAGRQHRLDLRWVVYRRPGEGHILGGSKTVDVGTSDRDHIVSRGVGHWGEDDHVSRHRSLGDETSVNAR